MIIAHRGGAPHLGENTSMAFEEALKSGADMLEMDVQRTVDGQLVVIHDSSVMLASGLRRPVNALPLGELKRTVEGLLTFDEYLEQFGRKLPTNVDIKRSGYEYELVGALRRHDLVGQVLISSRNVMSLRQMKFLAPESHIGLSRGQIVPWLDREPHSAIAASVLRSSLMTQLPVQGAFAMADTFMLNYRLITPWLVRYLRACGFRVACWTVNEPETVRWLIDAGVDYIATDYPARVVQFLKG